MQRICFFIGSHDATSVLNERDIIFYQFLAGSGIYDNKIFKVMALNIIHNIFYRIRKSGLLKIGSSTVRIADSISSTRVVGGTHPDSMWSSATRL